MSEGVLVNEQVKKKFIFASKRRNGLGFDRQRCCQKGIQKNLCFSQVNLDKEMFTYEKERGILSG